MGERFKRLLWEWRGVWLTAPTVAGLVLLLRFIGILQAWEWAAFDLYLRLRPEEPQDNRIVIVGIDEADVREIGQSIIPDRVYAQLLKKLKAKQPRVIGLDIYRDLPVEPGHQELVEVFASTPNLVGIQKVVGDNRREAVPAPPVLKAKGQIGANDLILDADNKVRRGLVYVQDPKQETVFSFGMQLALRYLDVEGVSVQPIPGTTEEWRLGKATFTRFQANDGGYVRADAHGYQLLLNYRGPSRHFPTVSMSDILKDRVPKDWGRDRIILIGGVGETFPDLHFTPYSSGLLSLPVPMAGVEIHANIISQMISAAKEGRPFFKSWSEPGEVVWILFWSTIGSLLTWQRRYRGGVTQFSWRRVSAALLAGVTLLGSSYVAFLGSWWIPIVPPILALSGSAIAITAYVAHTASRIRQTFGRYLTDQIVANLLENPEGLKLGGERRTITILTSDLRGFTSFAEKLPPEEVVKILNYYLGAMADVITSYQGTIDEFMGDGILVLFGAPTAREDDATRAVACAIGMQLAMVSVNQTMKEWGFGLLEMGIGINTGIVVVGNIGSEKRTKYGVVGSAVNLTYRIESYTVGGQILISESTLKKVGSIVKIDGQRQVQSKGVQEPIPIYEVGGIGGEYNLFLLKEEEVFFPLPEAIPLQYRVLDGKHIGDTLFKGSLVELSAKGGKVCRDKGESDGVPSPLVNIKLNLLTSNTPIETSVDVYGKVLEKTAEPGSFYLYFTAKPLDVEARLDALYKSLERKV